MKGGYAIPEFGLAYVRDIRIFKSLSSDEHRRADMLVSACYCMIGHELYNNPKNNDDVTIDSFCFNKIYLFVNIMISIL